MTANQMELKAIQLMADKKYEEAIDCYGELCELEENKGFNSSNIHVLIEYANALFKNAVQKNDIFDKQQQHYMQQSDVYKEKYTLLDVEQEDVDDFETAFDVLERAKQIATDNQLDYTVLSRIEQLLADICFEDSNFVQALDSYLHCCTLYEEAKETQKLAYTYYYVAMVYEFANSPSETMNGKDSSILDINELERIQKAKEYIEKCLQVLQSIDNEEKQDLLTDVEQKVFYLFI